MTVPPLEPKKTGVRKRPARKATTPKTPLIEEDASFEDDDDHQLLPLSGLSGAGATSGIGFMERTPGTRKREWNDLGNANRLNDHFGDRIVWANDAGVWLIYDDKRWVVERTDNPLRRYAWEALRLAEKFEAPEYDDTTPTPEPRADGKPDGRKKAPVSQRDTFESWLATQKSTNAVNCMIREFRSLPEIQARMSDFDRNGFLWNANNGTVDLKTGRLREHNPDDRLTVLSPVDFDPEATCPRWTKFLREVQPEAAVRAYLARVVGYSMTGSVAERAMFIHHGAQGSNGKSVFLKVMKGLFGDYFQNMAKTAIISTQHEEHTTGIARIIGKRFLAASETKAGSHLNDVVVKEITSGDPMSARFMGKDFFDLIPVGKIHLATNFMPLLSNSGKHIGGRIRAIGWEVVIPDNEMIKDLDEQIARSELPGILNWAVAGCREWLSGSAGVGLAEPRSVTRKTKAHIANSDPLRGWLDEECSFDEDAPATEVKHLFDSYRRYCDDNKVKNPMSIQMFPQALVERGAQEAAKHPRTRLRRVSGIRFRTADDVKRARVLKAVPAKRAAK